MLRAVTRSHRSTPGGHLQACRQALHVPLEGAGQRLVEVVDVEQHLPFRGSEAPEVREMSIPAQLHGQVRV